MTTDAHKLHAVFLAVLVVLGPFAGTAAFAGGAAAAVGSIAEDSSHIAIGDSASFTISDGDNPSSAVVGFTSSTETEPSASEDFTKDTSATGEQTVTVSNTPIADTNGDGAIDGADITVSADSATVSFVSADPTTGDVTYRVDTTGAMSDTVTVDYDHYPEANTGIDASSGSATTSIPTASSDSSGTLEVSDTDSVTAYYWDSSESTYRTASLTVDGSAPSINNIALTDTADGDGVVADGDTVEVTADVTDATSGVDSSTVTVDGSNFGAGGSVAMVDDGSGADATAGDDTYTATFTVSTDSASGGSQGVDVSADDSVSNTNTATSSQTLAVDVNPDAPSVEGAVEYNSGDIEIAFSEGVFDANDGTSLTKSNFTVYVDDADVTSDFSFTAGDADDGRVVLTSSTDLRPSDDVEVKISNVSDAAGADFVTPGNETVQVSSQTIDLASAGDDDIDTTDGNAYAGDNVAFDFSEDGDTFEINTEDDFVFDGSTGTNSQVYVFNTTDRNTSAVYEVADVDDGSEATVQNGFTLGLRDLGFGLTVEDLNVTDDDTIEADVTANAGNRPVELELLDGSGDDINTSSAVTTDGQGELTFEFDTATADDGDALDQGEYTVTATDLLSGVEDETSEITVTQADDEEASFADSVITDERGDILEATVELTESSEATLTFGSSDDGVVANATVEDDDGDDEVTVYINTYRLDSSVSGNVFSVDSDSDDTVLAENLEDGTDDLVDAGDYDLEVQSGDQGVGTGQGVTESDDVATVTLEERSTETLRMWTGSSGEISSVSDLEDVTEAIEEGQITQSSDVAVGDLAVHQLEASGFEGALDARENEEVSSEFETLVTSGPLNLTIEEASPGANQDASELNLSYGDNVTVIADGPNDTYFVVVDTGDVDFDAPRDEELPSDEDTELETNVTVLQDDAGFDFTDDEAFDDDENEETLVEFTAEEPEASIDEPFNVSQASGQTVSGTTNVAPGTELTVRVRSQSGVSPSFLKTASPVIQPDGTFSATFDFSGQNVGDEYDVVVANTLLASDEEESGTVVESVVTATPTPEPDTDTATPEPGGDTATPEPDGDAATPDEQDTETSMPTDTEAPTSTPTSTPGFGVVVALTALLAAALLAVRREN